MTDAVACLCAGLIAALPATGAPALDWQIDATRSTLSVAAEVRPPFAGEPQRVMAVIRDWQATVWFDPAAPAAAQLDVTIDMTSATTGDPRLDADLAGPGWFDSAAHPLARYRAAGVTALAGGRYRADGCLLLRDTAMPVALEFDLAIEGLDAVAKGRASVPRSAFGMGLLVPSTLASAEVAVDVQIVARAGSAAPGAHAAGWPDCGRGP